MDNRIRGKRRRFRSKLLNPSCRVKDSGPIQRKKVGGAKANKREGVMEDRISQSNIEHIQKPLVNEIYIDAVPPPLREMGIREFNLEFPRVGEFQGVRNLGRLRDISAYGDEYKGNSVSSGL